MCLYSHNTQYSSKYKCNTKNSFNSEAHALNTISQQLHHMGGACCLHDTGVQKLTLNMLCSFLTSPGEGRPQHYITKEERSESHALTITEVMMTFLVLGAGVISAMLVLILENIIYYLRKTWKQKVQSY